MTKFIKQIFFKVYILREKWKSAGLSMPWEKIRSITPGRKELLLLTSSTSITYVIELPRVHPLFGRDFDSLLSARHHFTLPLESLSSTPNYSHA